MLQRYTSITNGHVLGLIADATTYTLHIQQILATPYKLSIQNNISSAGSKSTFASSSSPDYYSTTLLSYYFSHDAYANVITSDIRASALFHAATWLVSAKS